MSISNSACYALLGAYNQLVATTQGKQYTTIREIFESLTITKADLDELKHQGGLRGVVKSVFKLKLSENHPDRKESREWTDEQEEIASELTQHINNSRDIIMAFIDDIILDTDASTDDLIDLITKDPMDEKVTAYLSQAMTTVYKEYTEILFADFNRNTFNLIYELFKSGAVQTTGVGFSDSKPDERQRNLIINYIRTRLKGANDTDLVSEFLRKLIKKDRDEALKGLNSLNLNYETLKIMALTMDIEDTKNAGLSEMIQSDNEIILRNLVSDITTRSTVVKVTSKAIALLRHASVTAGDLSELPDQEAVLNGMADILFELYKNNHIRSTQHDSGNDVQEDVMARSEANLLEIAQIQEGNLLLGEPEEEKSEYEAHPTDEEIGFTAEDAEYNEKTFQDAIRAEQDNGQEGDDVFMADFEASIEQELSEQADDIDLGADFDLGDGTEID